ncbi:hypothetical protein NCLIV_010760 [Neospora caninum Liverpool]|uniref:EF-hand domain-containing protein n=1 Tax=Neospora caninum (strain Liverpool) TaxID=572307 RepID=F0VAB9_NEOCL|nr:hypothetical protein NCLIV_010760 [Neospora caninum Liverpool]CBZ50608.1 hypothetical protein NCLIV_010760 [Neospora caninum Liverpool]|eukprot:XP_003880641.1 hypothetical protein NCLIV_010760 [Neospora caninum Liverpool]
MFSSAAAEDSPHSGPPSPDCSGSGAGGLQGSASAPGQPSALSREQGRAISPSRRESSGTKLSGRSPANSRRSSNASRRSSASSFLSTSTLQPKRRDAGSSERGGAPHASVLSDKKAADETSSSRGSSSCASPVSPRREEGAAARTGVPGQPTHPRRGSFPQKKSVGGPEETAVSSGQSSVDRRRTAGDEDALEGPSGGNNASRRPVTSQQRSRLLLARQEEREELSSQPSPSDGSQTSSSRRTSLQLLQQKKQLLQLQQQNEQREREKRLLVQKLKATKAEDEGSAGMTGDDEVAGGSDEAGEGNGKASPSEQDIEERKHGGKMRGEGRQRQHESAKAGDSGHACNSETENHREGEETHGVTDARNQPAEVPDSEKFEWELTAQAIPYHQQGNPEFDAPAELEARHQLKEHPAIQSVLAEVWQVFQKDKNDCISRQEYTNVLMRICLVLLPTLSAESALAIIDNDWRRDCRGSPYLTFNLFRDAFFELADLWTPVVDGEAYATFLSKLFKRITVQQITRRESAEKIRVVPRIVVRFRTKKAPSSRESPPSSHREVVALVRNPTDEPRMTAEWTEEGEKELREALEQGLTGADVLAFDEDVVHPPLPSPLPDTLAVQTVWAEKDEIAPLGAAAQAMVDAVLRQTVQAREDGARKQDGEKEGEQGGEQEGEQGEQEYKEAQREQDGRQGEPPHTAVVYHRGRSGPPAGDGGWPFARRMQEGAEYRRILERKRRWGKAGQKRKGSTEAEKRDGEQAHRKPVETESEGTGGGDRDREDTDGGKGDTERQEAGGESDWNVATVERAQYAMPEAFEWPLRNSGYFQSPEKMREPLNVAHERGKLRREKDGVRPGLSITVSLGTVPKVVVVDGEVALSDRASRGDAFVIAAADDGLFEALEEVKGSEKAGGEEGTAREEVRVKEDVPSPLPLYPGDDTSSTYVHEAQPATDTGPGLLERDMVNLAITPKQAILVTGPGIPEKSKLAYKLARKLGLLRQLQAGKAVSASDALRLASEFMASRRARAAGYVLELPSDSPQAVERFLRTTKAVSGKPSINWGEFLARQALEGIQEAEERESVAGQGDEEGGKVLARGEGRDEDETSSRRRESPGEGEARGEEEDEPPEFGDRQRAPGGEEEKGADEEDSQLAEDEGRGEEENKEGEDGAASWTEAALEKDTHSDKRGKGPEPDPTAVRTPSGGRHASDGASSTKEQGEEESERKSEDSQKEERKEENTGRHSADTTSSSEKREEGARTKAPSEGEKTTEEEDAPDHSSESREFQIEDGQRSEGPVKPREKEREKEEREKDGSDGTPTAVAGGRTQDTEVEKRGERALELPEKDPEVLRFSEERQASASPLENEREREVDDQRQSWSAPEEGQEEESEKEEERAEEEERDEDVEGEGEEEREKEEERGEAEREEERGEAEREEERGEAEREEERGEAEREEEREDEDREGERKDEDREEERAKEDREGERDDQDREGERKDEDREEGEEGEDEFEGEVEIDERQEAQEALEKARQTGERVPNPLVDVYPREVVLVQVETEDIDAIAKSFGIDAENGGTVRVLDSTVRTFRKLPLAPGKSTDSLSTVNKSFVDEPPMDSKDLDIGEDLLTALRRMFPPAFACPANPPLRSALSRPGGIGENGKMYFPALTAEYLREQRELANDILSDIRKAGMRAMKLFHGETSTSGMARILATRINKTPAEGASAPPPLQYAAPLPTPIRGVEPFTPLAELLTLGLEEARARERREAEEEDVEERQDGEASADEDEDRTSAGHEGDDASSLASQRASRRDSRTSSGDADGEGSDASSWRRSASSREGVEAASEAAAFSRIWSAWKQTCPVTLFEEGVAVEGRREMAVDYAGRVFLFADEAKQKRFLDDPKTFLGRPPALRAKIAVALSGANRSVAVKQAALLADAFGLVAVDVQLELQLEQQRAEAWERRMQAFERRREEQARERERRQADREREDAETKENDGAGRHLREEETNGVDPLLEASASGEAFRAYPGEAEEEEPTPRSPREFQLTDAERAALKEGKPLGEETIARVVAFRLGLARNVEILEERRAEEARLRAFVEDFEKKQAESDEALEFPADLPVDPDTHEPALPPLALLPPPAGFVIVHLGRTKREDAALAEYGIQVQHWIHFTEDVGEEEKEAHKMLADLQADADAAADAIARVQRLRPAACPNSSLPQPRLSQDFLDPLGKKVSLLCGDRLEAADPSPEKEALTTRSAASSAAPCASELAGDSLASSRPPGTGAGVEKGRDAARKREPTDASLPRDFPADGTPEAGNEGEGRQETGARHAEETSAATDRALLTQAEERLFLEYEEGHPESDLDVPIIPIYMHLSDMAKHYRIRRTIDPFFTSPDDPETTPPLPDLSAVLAQIDDCNSLQRAPEDRRGAPYSPSFPFLPPLPPIFYGETGHYCPVSLRRQQWLLPGKPECAVSVQQRIYMCCDSRAQTLFSLNPREFMPSSYLDQEDSEESAREACDLAGQSAFEAEEETFYAKVEKEVHVPPPRIAFLGGTGSGVSTHMELFNRSAWLPVLHFPSHFSRALKRCLLRYRRREEAAKQREAWRERREETRRRRRSEGGDGHEAGGEQKADEVGSNAAESPDGRLLDALALAEPEDDTDEDELAPKDASVPFCDDRTSPNSAGGAEELTTNDRLYGRYSWEHDIWKDWESFDLPEEKIQQIRVDAVRRVLHSAMGPVLIDGSSFCTLPPVQPPGDEDKERELALSAPSFASLTNDAQRLPDAVVIFTASKETAAQRVLDLAKIKREAIEDAKRKMAARQERQRKREERERRRAEAEELGEEYEEEEAEEEEEEEEEEEKEEEDEEEDGEKVDPLALAAQRASRKALRDFARRKATEDAIVLQSAKLFASARVPVLVVNSDRTEQTVQRAVNEFLQPFLRHRQSLLLSPQCMRLDKATCAQFLKSGVARHSRFGAFSPTDVDAMRPQPSVPHWKCSFAVALLQIARWIAEWSGAVYVTPQKALRQCIEEAKSSQLVDQVLHDLRRGRAVSPCCLIRVVHQRLRHSDALQRGFVLDGCPAHVGHAKRFQRLEALHQIEVPASSPLQDDVHLHSPSPSTSPRSASSRSSSLRASALRSPFPRSASSLSLGGARGREEAGAGDGPSRHGTAENWGVDEAREGGANAGHGRRQEEAERGRFDQDGRGEAVAADSDEAGRGGGKAAVFRKLASESFKAVMEKQERQKEAARKHAGKGEGAAREEAERWRRSRSSGQDETLAKETELQHEKQPRPHTAPLEDFSLSKLNAKKPTPSPRLSSALDQGAAEEADGETHEKEEAPEEGEGEDERDSEGNGERRENDGVKREEGERQSEGGEDGEVTRDEGGREGNEEEAASASTEILHGDRKKGAADVAGGNPPCVEQREDEGKEAAERRDGALRLAAQEARHKLREERDAQTLQEDEELEDDEDEESAIDIIFVFEADEHLTMRRAAKIHENISSGFPVQDERDYQANAAAQKERWSTYRSTIAPLQAYYSSAYSNVM